MSVHIVLIFTSLLASVFLSASPHSPVNDDHLESGAKHCTNGKCPIGWYKKQDLGLCCRIKYSHEFCFICQDKCFEENIHYIGLPLHKPGGNNNYGPTGSAEGCQLLCQQTDGCGWFNWERNEDKCWLKTGKGNQSKRKFGDVTGPRICPTTTTTTTSTTATTTSITTETTSTTTKTTSTTTESTSTTTKTTSTTTETTSTSTTTTAYEMCGLENKSPPRPTTLSNGVALTIPAYETLPNQYPWMVRIHIGPFSGCEQWCRLSGGGDCENSCKFLGCGGSLITDRHVLTAKHCLKDAKYVKVGVHNQSDPRDYKMVKIKNDVTHTADDDIAIIILETPVDLKDETIGTVCLPTNADQDYKRKEVLALGWGWTPGHFQSMVLQHVGLTVAGGHRNAPEYLLFTKGSHTPSGVPVDVCNGDSGGPLLYKQDGRWSIIATVHGGPSCNYPNPDRPDGIWNKVTYHLDWIKKVIQEQN